MSIITPLYNGEEFIKDAVESVLAQTYENWELLVIDDGSADNGYNIVKEYSDKDKRIKLLKNEKNSGVTNHNLQQKPTNTFVLLHQQSHRKLHPPDNDKYINH